MNLFMYLKLFCKIPGQIGIYRVKFVLDLLNKDRHVNGFLNTLTVSLAVGYPPKGVLGRH